MNRCSCWSKIKLNNLTHTNWVGHYCISINLYLGILYLSLVEFLKQLPYTCLYCRLWSHVARKCLKTLLMHFSTLAVELRIAQTPNICLWHILWIVSNFNKLSECVMFWIVLHLIWIMHQFRIVIVYVLWQTHLEKDESSQ